jgi:copper chaperone CopZ
MVTKAFRIPDMHCSSCPMRLEGLEDEIPGVKQVRASYHRQEMVVEYDEARVTPDQIVEAARKLGYQAVPVDASS